MTVADSDRRTDAEKLLTLLLEQLGDNAIDIQLFNSNDSAFAAFLNTSWSELEASEFIVSTPVPPSFYYRMTAVGWIEALVRRGFLDDESVNKRVGLLAAALKRRVKGRATSAAVSLDIVAQETGIPSGWVFNAIDSRLLNRISLRRDAFWLEGARGRLIAIPQDFGVAEIDLFDDIRSQNEQLRGELTAIRDELGEYRCPHCSAPLSIRNDVDLDEHTIGTVESFACGYSSIDGFLESPCPSDPKLPKLEDFELRTSRRMSNPLIRDRDEWTCSPVGKTPMAKKLHLSSASGSTEAEAKE